MKYLIVARTGAAPIPQGKAVDLFKAAKQWINAQIASGKMDCHYVLANANEGFSIVNAESHEEVMDMLLSYPLYPFLHWEINALCDSDHSYDKFIELWQKFTT